MKSNKVFSILLMISMFFGVFTSLSGVNAFSDEVLDLDTFGFDNSQQTFVNIDIHNIFAIGNKILDYDTDGNLIRDSSIPYTTNITITFDFVNDFYSHKSSIIEYNSTFCIIAHVFTHTDVSANPDINSIYYETFFYNINTGSFTSFFSGYQYNIYTIILPEYFHSNIAIIQNFNSTGRFYYIAISCNIDDSNDKTRDLLCYIGKFVNNIWTTGNKQEFYRATVDNFSFMTLNTLILDSSLGSIPENTAFVITSNNWRDGNRANIYILSFSPAVTYTFIGVTAIDYTYAGTYNTNYIGLVYLIGFGAYGNKIYVNIAHSTSLGSTLDFETLIFNSSYVSHSKTSLGGLSSGSVNIRPFTVSFNNYGNESGVYTIGYFDDVVSPYYLTLYSATLTEIETENPIWTFNQFGTLFTPQQPQYFPYSNSSNNWGGFQPIGSNIGVFIDMQNGKAIVNTLEIITTSNVFSLIISGGIFNSATLAQAPTEVKLQQNIQYTLTGKIYVNAVLSGTGNYSVLTSEFITTNSIFNAYDLTNKIDGTITGGTFQFIFSPVSATQTVYRVLQVNFTLTDGTVSMNYIYNFGFYALGSEDDNGNVPYPSPIPTGGGSGVIIDGSGGSVPIDQTEVIAIFTNWQNIILIIIYAVICGLCTYLFGFTGLIAGFNIATILCLIIGILGSLMYPVIGLLAVADIALIITGSGLLNRNKIKSDGN